TSVIVAGAGSPEICCGVVDPENGHEPLSDPDGDVADDSSDFELELHAATANSASTASRVAVARRSDMPGVWRGPVARRLLLIGWSARPAVSAGGCPARPSRR